MLTAKAQLKPVEELPEWMRCCEGAVNGYIVALVTLPKEFNIQVGGFISSRISCDVCGFVRENVPCVRTIGIVWPVAPTESLEIQEGPDDGEDFYYV